MIARLPLCVGALVLGWATSAAAEQALVLSAAKLRSGSGADQSVGKRADPFAIDLAVARPALDAPRSTYEAPGRYYGPIFWTYGPDIGPYRGTSGIGYRGRW